MKKFLAALALVTGVALMSIGAVQSANAAGGKILICHATNNGKKPYQVISVSASANGYGHHALHTGPLGTPQLIASLSKPYGPNAWGDVLPPAVIDGTTYPGQNWFGQVLVKGDPATCVPVVATTPTPTTPAPTTPAPTTPATIKPTLPATGGDAPQGLLVAGGLLAAAGVVALGGAQLAGRRN